MTRVLVTGFEPFDGADTNPSWEAVRQLDLPTMRLPVVYGAAMDELWAAVERTGPDIVICAGLAGERTEISVERLAVNLEDAGIPDNAGVRATDRPVVPGGPAAYFATIPVKSCVRGVRAIGVPAGLSYSAGTFVCNHVFYGLLHRAATERPGLRAGFVHVPDAAVLPVDSIAKALRTVVDVTLEEQ